jgi:hypothetical protein
MMNITQKNSKKFKSKVWRMNHLYWIKDKEGVLVRFRLNKAQKKYIIARGKHRYNIIVKPRQKGFTTFHCIDMLDDALWIPGSSCPIIAHQKEAVVAIFEIVKRAFDNLEPGLKPQTKYDNKNELQFISNIFGKLDTKIYVSLKLRSGTATKLHVSESAYIDDRTVLNAGSKQAIGKSGKITEETTGNGFNEFYDEVMAAIDTWDKQDGIPQQYKKKVFFYSWFDDDEYELVTPGIEIYDEEEKKLKEKYNLGDSKLAWRRWKMNELGKSDKTKLGLTPLQLFKQEYPSSLMEAFQASGSTFFDQDLVELIEPKNPIRINDFGLNIWYEPIAGHRYVVGVDPSNGKGIDNASVNIWDVTPNEPIYKQVAQWHGFKDPHSLAAIVQASAEFYNDALASVENNLLTTVLVLSKTYDKVYFTIKIDKKTEQQTMVLGFSTNLKTRPVMMDNFNKLFSDGLLEINSMVTKSEMRTFIVKENKKIEHADGKHDDSLFADFIGLETRNSFPVEIEIQPSIG